MRFIVSKVDIYSHVCSFCTVKWMPWNVVLIMKYKCEPFISALHVESPILFFQLQPALVSCMEQKIIFLLGRHNVAEHPSHRKNSAIKFLRFHISYLLQHYVFLAF